MLKNVILDPQFFWEKYVYNGTNRILTCQEIIRTIVKDCAILSYLDGSCDEIWNVFVRNKVLAEVLKTPKTRNMKRVLSAEENNKPNLIKE